jgi:hypothetical protein
VAQAIQQPSAPDSRPPQPKCDRDSLKRPICIEPPCRPSWSLIMCGQPIQGTCCTGHRSGRRVKVSAGWTGVDA